MKVLEFKVVTIDEFLSMFLNHSMSTSDILEFKRTSLTTMVVKLPKRNKYRPVYRDYIGAFFLVRDRKVYCDH